ncbi:pyruvate, phosphate dikinase [Candidatus Peregrinibacteria bacterium CG_4_10_14_0_2_um_filter_38_24]|nr:MAG: pyruvate, phosphate dikinase [Candidatus Peregrinibacteria bacterium CG_4_10_14_0_2_um_filter_38_24]PJC39045.1 MAG: pyruvate, phosphate dikinase [Candidatus Peregrinibacteria bacterium CG_4_9_14_0_2_um_filter_38_9]
MIIPSSSIEKASDIRRDVFLRKYIYSFDEGDKSMRDLLGGKGSNLAEMTGIGIPVPFGFTITTEVCEYFVSKKAYPEEFAEQLEEKLNLLEIRTGKKLGDSKNPLLVSVRSGAAVSMPGMMDTILNLGLNDETIEGVIANTENARFAYDCYRRFVQMFGNVVLGVSHDLFEEAIEKIKEEKNVKQDTDLTADDLKKLVYDFKEIISKNSDEEFPENPLAQMKLAIEAVFNSWDNDRAKTYRKINNITGLKGTAVNVQSMVFGNMGDDSGTGVAFTRNPSTGAKEFYGEFLMNAQGEDVVAGIRTPSRIEDLKEINEAAYNQLIEIKDNLEKHYKDMQDIEFTIERGNLFLLQTRNGKRTSHAAIKIAVDLVAEGLLSKEEALLKVDAAALSQLLHPQIKKSIERNVIAKGLPASPGAACGKVVFSADDAFSWATEKDEKVILVRKETSPEDIHGMHVAQGILTSRGGMTSHAAVVARGMGKCCVAGCAEVIVNASAKKIIIGDLVINEGDRITLDGGTGEVILGSVELEEPKMSEDFKTIMDWADKVRIMKVRTNADTPKDCQVAIDFGAEGIGLCRTEHMFFDEERIPMVRKMILSKDDETRGKQLKKLKEFQKGDFVEIFKVMEGKPMTIRLLDPPLHEFLPEKEEDIRKLAEDLDTTFEDLKMTISNLHEINPMLGHRGCRLGITFPDIYRMQAQAISEAAIEVSAGGTEVNVEFEIPLVGFDTELKNLKKLVEETILSYGDSVNFNYKIGTMIEVPRACLTANELAKEADFFSFGTNDLTQMTLGFSRDDSGKFLNAYLEKGIFERDPTETIDQAGVGQLMRICIELARKEKPNFEIGICGEHGGDPQSVEFCHKIGLDYVSCSPYRVPVARLAAAQAVLKI